jgi:hypothetical protein
VDLPEPHELRAEHIDGGVLLSIDNCRGASGVLSGFPYSGAVWERACALSFDVSLLDES